MAAGLEEPHRDLCALTRNPPLPPVRSSIAMNPDVDPVAKARRINRTWLTQGALAENTARYLDHLAAARPSDLPKVCRLAIEGAVTASDQGQDPKPPFYANLFSTATKAERDTFLKDHFFTRFLSAEYKTRE